MIQDFKKLYLTDVIPYFKDIFQYQNIEEIPKLKKVTLNRGLGKAGQNRKILKKSIDEFRSITGQQPIITKAKKSIAGFKLREKTELGITVTLRKQKMYSFLERLINLAVPRLRDFQGLDPNQFDKYGNYTFGINDQLIFPEINYDDVKQQMGFNITITTTATNSKEGLALLKKMGIPFHN
jgi:large subunit ribosomal protein L5